MKKLIVDRNLKKIDSTKIGSPLKRITSGLLAGGMTISMYSGSLSNTKFELEDEKSIIYEDEINKDIYFGDDVFYEFPENIESFTGDRAMTSEEVLLLGFNSDNYNLSDLKYFENLKELDLSFDFPCNVFDILDRIPVMSSVERLSFLMHIVLNLLLMMLINLEKNFLI